MAQSPETVTVTNDFLVKELLDIGKKMIDLGMRLQQGFEVPVEYVKQQEEQ
ncbi:hypothetical protein [Leucobacter japonicus]|uniref:hypothetical protein n=1 Tax=Leucobacter japonicus TaxID=1461259 RepID=UPI000A78AE4E|nr:hypothetical protein [Leucobacter japonicus]